MRSEFFLNLIRHNRPSTIHYLYDKKYLKRTLETLSSICTQLSHTADYPFENIDDLAERLQRVHDAYNLACARINTLNEEVKWLNTQLTSHSNDINTNTAITQYKSAFMDMISTYELLANRYNPAKHRISSPELWQMAHTVLGQAEAGLPTSGESLFTSDPLLLSSRPLGSTPAYYDESLSEEGGNADQASRPMYPKPH